jgi:hypothetical protein
MIRAALVSTVLAILGVILVTSSCAQIPAITAAVVGEVQCVEGEIAKGDDTFEAIALACAPLAVSDVVTIVGALATSSPTLADKAKLVHHKSAP